MAMDRLFGVTDNMYHLGAVTRGNAESLNATGVHLNGSLESALRPTWIGTGSNAFFARHESWLAANRTAVVQELDSIGNNITTAAQIYDYNEGDVTRVAGSGTVDGAIGQAINPTA